MNSLDISSATLDSTRVHSNYIPRILCLRNTHVSKLTFHPPLVVTHSYHGQTYIQCFYTSCSSLWCAIPLCSTLKQRKAGQKRGNINSSPMDHEGKCRIYTYNRHSIELNANSNIIRHPSTLQRMPTFHLQSRFSGQKTGRTPLYRPFSHHFRI